MDATHARANQYLEQLIAFRDELVSQEESGDVRKHSAVAAGEARRNCTSKIIMVAGHKKVLDVQLDKCARMIDPDPRNGPDQVLRIANDVAIFVDFSSQVHR